MLHKTIMKTIYVLLSATHRNMLSFFYSFEIKCIFLRFLGIPVCRPGSVHKKIKKTYPKETSFFYNNQP